MGEKGSLTLILFGFLYSWLTSKLKVFWKCFETLLNKGKTEKTSLLFHNIPLKRLPVNPRILVPLSLAFVY